MENGYLQVFLPHCGHAKARPYSMPQVCTLKAMTNQYITVYSPIF